MSSPNHCASFGKQRGGSRLPGHAGTKDLRLELALSPTNPSVSDGRHVHNLKQCTSWQVSSACTCLPTVCTNCLLASPQAGLKEPCYAFCSPCPPLASHVHPDVERRLQRRFFFLWNSPQSILPRGVPERGGSLENPLDSGHLNVKCGLLGPYQSHPARFRLALGLVVRIFGLEKLGKLLVQAWAPH